MSNIDKRKRIFKKIAEQNESESDENFVNDVNNADDVSEFVDKYVDSLIEEQLNTV